MSIVNIGSRRELFWDDALIESSRTTGEFKIHQPRIGEIVLTHDAEWEGDGCCGHCFLEDDDVYRLYYIGWEMMKDKDKKTYNGDHVLCYAESKDGIHWEKPDLGIIEYNGSKHNNIIMDKIQFTYGDLTYFFKDENPACPPDQKYKAVGANQNCILSCWVSADGIHFREGWELSRNGTFDTLNVVLWIPEEKQYVAYIRNFHDSPPGQTYEGIRDIRRMTSPDFIHWSEPVRLDFKGGQDYPLYTNNVRRYNRAPHMYIGFPMRYTQRKEWSGNYDQLPGIETRKRICGASPRYGLAVSDSLFMVSRDGKSFRRYDEAFLTPGIERVHNWFYGDAGVCYGLFETPSPLRYAPDEITLYSFENHWQCIPAVMRRYTIRKDGFCSMHANYGERKVCTVPLTFEGSKMELNFSTSGRGYVYIKVVSDDRVLNSCELFGDALDRVVPFDGDLSELAGKKVTLEFTFSDADLYSYRFFD